MGHLRINVLQHAGHLIRRHPIERTQAHLQAAVLRRLVETRNQTLNLSQITATGATWLDRQNIARGPVALSEGGFGAEVRQAMSARADHLVEQGFGERHGQRVTFSRNLIDTLRRRELEALGEKLASQNGQPFNRAASGEYVAGAYRQRFTLASGRFAMIDDGLGFQLVPWASTLEQQLGRQVSGIVRAGGGIDWTLGRKRGLGI